MFLFHMSVQSWVTEVSLITVLALEVSSLNIIFASSLVLSSTIAIRAITIIICKLLLVSHHLLLLGCSLGQLLLLLLVLISHVMSLLL